MGATAADERSGMVSPGTDERFPERTRTRRPGGAGRWLGVGLALVLLAALGGGGYLTFASFSQAGGGEQMVTAKVIRGPLLITITEDGNVESAKNVELKCEVTGSSTILEIVPDGTQVQKGDVLVRLDSSTIEENINQQRIAVAKAEASKIGAEKEWSAAKIAVQGYVEGTYVQELQAAEANITIAMENLRSAENILQHTQKMARKAFVTPLQLESHEFAVKRAKLDLAVAETAKTVLVDYTKAETLEELYSKRDSAKARTDAEVAAYDLEAGKLKRLEGQLAKCIIKAPQGGMVVYANDMTAARFGQQGPKVEQGAPVKEFQAIVRLPDLSNMQVKVLVHESKVEFVHRGRRARIRIQDRELQGTVMSVSNQPETGQWWGSNIKEYAAYVKIDGQRKDLKPGMTADVTILVDQKKDVLSVPVQCVVEKGKKFHAWVKTPTGVEPRELLLGGTNDTYIEVTDGLKEGDLVLQNPRSDVAEAREDAEIAEKVDVKKTFGEAAPADQTTSPAASSVAGGPPAGAPEGGASPGGGGGPGGGGAQMPDFASLDKDGDQKLTKEEFPELARPVFDFVDANHDGFVDKAESDAAAAQRGQGQSGGGAGGGGPGGGRGFDLMQFDKDGDGKVSQEEAPERMRQFFGRVDTDGDGFLDNAEISAMRSRFQRQGGPGGPGGGGPPGAAAPGGGAGP